MKKIMKKLALVLGAVGFAIMPLAARAANIAIESTINVRNTTTNTQYAKSTEAKVDEVVAIQVWYHNKEEADSGLVANNLKVKINLPTTAGKSQTINSTVSADNTNTVTDNATVNLSLDRAFLEYIPGSAQWRHNAGTNENPNFVTTNISDDVVNGGVVLENVQPCFNFEATVTILVRVKAPVVSITKQVRVLGEKAWVTANTAKPGDTLEYLITFKNEGNTVLRNVVVGDNMPARVTYVNGTTMLKNGANPNGIKITSDNITKGGIDVGNYTPGAVGYVWFQAKIVSNLTPGNWKLENVAVVRPQGMNEFFNVATTTISIPVGGGQLPPTPQPLPVTGGEGAAAGLFGTGILGYATRGYWRSKRALLNALKR
jgi:uncharacterized repeat protein (TIGR01451 family)